MDLDLAGGSEAAEDVALEAALQTLYGPPVPNWPATEADKSYVRAAIEEGCAELERGEGVSSDVFEAGLTTHMARLRSR